METLKGRFKGETGINWHMLPLVDVTESGIKIRRWVGRWWEILVEEDGRSEGLVLQNIQVERTRICDIDERFQEDLRKVKNQ